MNMSTEIETKERYDRNLDLSHESSGPNRSPGDPKVYDPFYLQLFENNYRENVTLDKVDNLGKMDNLDKIEGLGDYGLNYMDNMDSIENLDFVNPHGLRDGSHAYPPSEYPQNTPSLRPKANRNGSGSGNALGAGVGSGNVGYLFQSPILPSQDQKSFNQEHLLQKQKQRRKNTPLASPAVTPLDHYNQVYAPNVHDFEPLTSPALKAQQANAQLSSVVSSERRRSLSTFNCDYNGGTPAKRRTPLLTPNMQAANSKPKQSPILRKVPQPFEPLPASSHDTNSTETTPMLPPQGKKMVIENGFAPGLMSFTMNRLAEQQKQPYEKKEEDLYKDKGDYRTHYVSSLSETSPVIDPQNDDYGKRDRPAVKKTSHKLAEQGRRNRMNMAVQELSNLIPREIREKVTVPSKATTVELASSYIRQLVEELDELRETKVKKEPM